MISEKQVLANQENAKKGGVRTPEGKTISKLNALTHGLLSQEVLLEGDDAQSLTELEERLRSQLNPIGELEKLLVDRITANIWRLRRVLEVEKATMEWEKTYELEDEMYSGGRKQTKRKATSSMILNENIEKITRYETTIERGIYKALHELQRLQATRMGERPLVPLAVDIDVSRGD